LEKHPHLSTEVENHPEIYVLQFDETAKDGKVNQRRGWHADLTCDEIPTMGAVLYIQELPKGGGGDTLWASMYAAYEALADPMKRFLLGLTAVHDGRVYLEAGNNRRDLEVPTAEHPIIRTHPITRRRGLFVNQTFTQRIPQLNLEESEAILQMLFRHIERPEFQCRFKWEMGSLAIWDNRCTQHNPVRDYFPNKRRVHRVTIAGSKPFLDLSGAP